MATTCLPPPAPAGDLRDAVAHAKARCGLSETVPVVIGYKAGRAGFWLHRFVQAHSIPTMW